MKNGKVLFCDLLVDEWELLDEAEQERVICLLKEQAMLIGQRSLIPALLRSLNWLFLSIWRWEVGNRMSIRSSARDSGSTPR